MGRTSQGVGAREKEASAVCFPWGWPGAGGLQASSAAGKVGADGPEGGAPYPATARAS